ncbi:MAG TPA: DUF2961 domain-containing protein [Armatimonadota bacterium]|jgi:hypothetical protein
MQKRFVLLSLLGILCAPAFAASPFRQLYDLDDLPLLKPGVRTYQVSSHDPTGGNADAGHFVRVEGNVKVLADLKGPGIVRRLWSANPSGRLRITVDGAVVVDAPFQDLFEAKVRGFTPPIAGRSSGGWYSYVPIAFEKSCLITATDAGNFYYQVTWQKLPQDSKVTPFGGDLSESDAGYAAKAEDVWSHLGAPLADSRAVALPKRFVSLPPGGRWAQPIQGPGTITSLRFAFPAGVTWSTLRQTVLRISFDGEKSAVEAPLADFLGMGFEGVRWKSLPLGVEETGGYCYFRMPFARSARIELENQSRSAFQASFSGLARPGVPATPYGYFHANYHSAVNVGGRDYVFGRLQGVGHVVGVTESMRGNGSLWFLEGDEKVYVDGSKSPDIYGTGTEDFYNCGWYFQTGLVDVALHGLSHKTDNEIAAWRFEIPDAIPFRRFLDFHIEHGGTDDVAGSEYSSVIYWYGKAGSKYVAGALPRGSALLPRPFVAPIEGAIQAADANWVGTGGATIRKEPWQTLGSYRGAGRTLIKGAAGSGASFGVEARFTDDYDVDVYLSGAGTASQATLILDGSPVGTPMRDTGAPLPIRKVSAGAVRLTEGKHALGVRITSGSSIAIAAVRVQPRSPLVRDFAVLGPFPIAGAEGAKTPLPADGKAPDLSRAYAVGSRSLKWTVLRAPNGLLDLAATLSPHVNVAAYVAFAVKSPHDQTLPLMIGSDDGVQVWANGALVTTNNVVRGFRLDEDRVPVSLKAGWNTIVLKVAQKDLAWAVSARLPDPGRLLQFAPIPPAS